MKTIIIDIDGTIALNTHREHLIKEAGWDAYFLACGNDAPNAPVVELLRRLKGEYRFHYFSGRGAIAAEETYRWFSAFNVPTGVITMRPIGDYRPDEELKLAWLNEHYPDRNAVAFVLDDRQKVVDMWRREGLTCLQVAPGDF